MENSVGVAKAELSESHAQFFNLFNCQIPYTARLQTHTHKKHTHSNTLIVFF